jgi:drug/metabolite transporter (DMT)-like permease
LNRGRGAAAAALLVNAFIFGLSWWPFRRLESYGLHPLWATALTYLLAISLLLLVRPQAWRGLVRYPQLWLLVFSSGMTNVGFNWAITVGDVVRVVLLFYLMPAWSVLLAWWLLSEKPTVGALLRLLLALGGVAVVLKSPEVAWPVPQSLPDWLALMGGFFFALTNVLLRKFEHTPDTARVLSMFAGGASMAACVAWFGVTQGIVTALPAPAPQWLLLAALMSLAVLAANFALQYGAARLSAHSTALIMLSEVVFASASSVWLSAAQPDARTLVGGALILLAAALSAWPQGTVKPT